MHETSIYLPAASMDPTALSPTYTSLQDTFEFHVFKYNFNIEYVHNELDSDGYRVGLGGLEPPQTLKLAPHNNPPNTKMLYTQKG